MKFVYDDINGEKYIINFHDLHLYLQKNKKLQYLFTNSIHIYKKYILDIDYYDFKNFINSCLENKSIVESRNSFELQCVQLIEKLLTSSSIYVNINFKLYCCQKLGSLILYNCSYKDFQGLKKIHSLFTSITSEPDVKINSLNSQIRYLVIILNNFIGISIIKHKIKEQYTSKKIQNQINMLDFIYDYYEN